MNAQRQYEILVVDDELPLTTAAMRLLGNIDKDPITYKGKFSLSTTNCGNNAIDFLRGGYTPDVILSDLNMPNGTGLELVEWIRGNRKELLQRVILMTGDPGSLADFAGQMRREGCSVIGKPFDVQELRTAIDKVLEATQAGQSADPEVQEEEVDPSERETQENPIVTLRQPLRVSRNTEQVALLGGGSPAIPLGSLQELESSDRPTVVIFKPRSSVAEPLTQGQGEKSDQVDGSSEDKE